MTYHDFQYQDMLKYIMEFGVDSEDRTGTGTKKVWVCALRFDLQEGFPLLTTKRMHWKSIVYELLWFLRGETNIKWLNERGVHVVIAGGMGSRAQSIFQQNRQTHARMLCLLGTLARSSRWHCRLATYCSNGR